MPSQATVRNNRVLSTIYFVAALTFFGVAYYMARTFEIWSPLLLTLSAASLSIAVLTLLTKRPFITYLICVLTYVFAIQQSLSSLLGSSIYDSLGLLFACTAFFSTPLIYLLIKQSQINSQHSLRDTLFTLPTFRSDAAKKSDTPTAANS